MNIQLPTSRNKGFTIMEMVVSSGFFITAVVIIMGALVSLESASRKVRATRVAMDNVGAAIDSMSRTMRMGATFNCGCTAPLDTPVECEISPNPNDVDWGTCVAFEHQNGNIRLATDQYMYRRNVVSGVGRLERSKNSGTTWEALTAPEINITELKLWMGGVDIGVDQPYVTMVIRGTASTSAKTATSFNVQTTVAQRVPNLDLIP